MQNFAQFFQEIRTARWNTIVTKKMMFMREEPDHYVFLHATKGWRFVSKKRLGLA